jgi:hypothetical protein
MHFIPSRPVWTTSPNWTVGLVIPDHMRFTIHWSLRANELR